MPEQMTRAQFAASIKAKHPVYAQIPDDQLVDRMLEKHPVYKDRIKADAPQVKERPTVSRYGHELPADVVDVIDRFSGPIGVPMLPTQIAPAVWRAGMSAAARIAATVKATAGASAPAIKYELTKTGLEKLGMPSALAMPLAMAVSGYKRSAKPTATPSSAAPASPAASSPGAPVPPVAPSAPAAASTRPAGPQWSPQQLRNEVGLAARRQKATLTEQEYAVAEGMVKQGVSPADAVKTVAQQIAKPQAAPRLKLNVEEGKVYMALRGKGQSHQEAQEAIVQMRAMAKQFGLPSTKAVETQVAERNATGRWPE